MNEIFALNLGDNNVMIIVSQSNKGGQDFESTFNGLVCESEYERFSYVIGTDAYGEESMENHVLNLSIKDWNGKEYVRCSIDESILLAMKEEHGFLLMRLPELLNSENIKENLYGKELEDIEEWMIDMETKYNLPEYSLEGYLMCFFTEEEKEKVEKGDWDS